MTMKPSRTNVLCVLTLTALLASSEGVQADASGAATGPAWREKVVQDILAGARAEVDRKVPYYLENRYLKTFYLDGVKQKKPVYPWGDIPPDIGVCTDLVIRALRNAGFDLQRRIYLDVLKDVKKKLHYPWGTWKKKTADKYIDHRRCPNQAVFFKRFADVVKVGPDGADPAQFRPGDIVYWDLEIHRYHVGIVSDRKTKDGVPLVMHNFPTPGYAAEEDVLTGFKLLYRFRYPPETPDPPANDLVFKPKPKTP